MTSNVQSGQPSRTDYPIMNERIRVTFDQVRHEYTVLSPETVAVLNPTGAAILQLCDGRHAIGQIVDELDEQFAHVDEDDVIAYINQLATLGYIGGWDGYNLGDQ